ncbi:MAG TPA: hypothetical protein IAA06_12300 [Candidatus Blautia faecavium]|uniref:Uncharacterized protein n=1 Tax=Candidatus Blautia faecavium TaxID=2838487 RepID=A0A9D2LU82_9FIRM|nr:hypothetical protein [Candidatus Blautia faecavium]
MKKQYLVLAGLLICSIAISGCGSNENDSAQQANVTVVPTESPDEEELVDMQVSTDDETIDNIIGTRTNTASEVTIVNETGGEITEIYIRPYNENNDDYEWGDELVNGSFTLQDGDKALYYYEKDAQDDEGEAITLYDIRVAYAEEDRNECYFRMLPLPTISQITLCMEGTGADSIPYARYYDSDTRREYSTLNDVMERLGISSTDTSDSDTSEEEDDNGTDTQTPQNTPEPTQTPSQTQAPEPTQAPSSDELIEQAKGCIGQSVDALYSAVGEPSGGSEYVNEPESGETGYYYYDTFTVSTTVDENGNEVVAGVW